MTHLGLSIQIDRYTSEHPRGDGLGRERSGGVAERCSKSFPEGLTCLDAQRLRVCTSADPRGDLPSKPISSSVGLKDIEQYAAA